MAENTKSAKKGSGKIATYFRELKSEFKKISWPSAKQVRNNTGIVIAFMVVLALLVALIDFGFQYLWTFITK